MKVGKHNLGDPPENGTPVAGRNSYYLAACLNCKVMVLISYRDTPLIGEKRRLRSSTKALTIYTWLVQSNWYTITRKVY